MSIEPLSEPLKVTAEDGFVVIDGSGVSITLQPDAALDTGDAIIEQAEIAYGQAAMKRARKALL